MKLILTYDMLISDESRKYYRNGDEMRVISGSKKGRSLQPVPGKSTRPTTDKVKEAIFSMLGRAYFDGGTALDLYAGTGGLGIEALSRGFERVIFVDQNRKAFDVVKQNLATLDLLDQSEVYKNEASRAIRALIKREISFDLIFLDPPYAEQQIASQLAMFNDYHFLQPQGIVVAETAKGVELPEVVGGIHLEKSQDYGDTEIRIYRLKEES
jgi:16S rRNA (guanine966-N2)-methyltransferase